MRSPDRGTPGEGFRFLVAGGTVAFAYFATTTTLADGFGVAFQVALIIGFTVGLVLHFTLQRMFVWMHHTEFALALHQQLWRYLVVAGLQYGSTAAITAFVPDALGLPVTAVYVMTMIGVSTVNFLVFRNRVFHPAVIDGRTTERTTKLRVTRR